MKMEEDKDKVWNFHACKSQFSQYRSKSTFSTYQHENIDVFICHSSAPEMFECAFCDFSCDLKVKLTEHVCASSERKGINSELEDILKRFRCKYCHFETYSVLILTKHLVDCNLKLKLNVPLRSLDGIGRKPDTNWFKCEKCVFKSKHKFALKRHIIAKHTDSEEINWFICEQCGFKTKEKSALKRHIIAKHTDSQYINWFECEKCAFRSKEKGILTKHIKNKHTKPEDISWYECDQCAFRTKHRYIVKRHTLSRHTNPKDKLVEVSNV